ncbi:Error-prone repair protein ImuA [Chitinophaga alhagiae]|uniref:Error-prone repair protein ImuA n=1 Tax=Chitinophaga alhagiae TaxID=2203219 RepID=A0ABM6WBP4_9BACT|nr:Error-prone repair protein ImuA [Chitinophaga alhagiae]AWO01355.1 Error-prone repair protein ImuA [Chitinophaga alhagiae]
MSAQKADIIAQLQKDILLLQGLRPACNSGVVDVGLGPVKNAFPGATFPTGAIHEFVSEAAEHAAASAGFISGLLGALMQNGSVCLWISTSGTIFPPALKAFGIEPDRVFFITLQREKDVLWAMEEALKCEGLAAVVGEVRELDFTASRRLQLAVEQSRATGFVLRHQPRRLHATACTSRWRITPLASQLEARMPGMGFPRWQVELLKVRNGRPGTWAMEWFAGKFRQVGEHTMVAPQQPVRKIV